MLSANDVFERPRLTQQARSQEKEVGRLQTTLEKLCPVNLYNLMTSSVDEGDGNYAG